MNEITAITPQVKDKRRCNIYIDGRFYCGLTLETTVKNRLKVGQTVSPETLSQIQLESEKNTALDKAMTHLSAARKTEKQIRDFLSKKGYLEAVADYVVDKLNDYGFLNDKEYAESYVEFAAKKKGVRLIRAQLRGKGLSEEDVDAALSGMDEENQIAAAKEILQKYMRGKETDKTTLQKATKYLMGKGFEYEVAKEAVATYGEIEED
ncbi:MAG: RecX family transcriptional regulator [Clostridia bacterium]|nr:RecX family transcriptional regulator [Clostridia bacterium]